MSSLVVGGVVIPVAANGIRRDRLDGVDRARAFDQTYRASVTGNPKRDFFFSSKPVTRGQADYYESILGIVTAQSCSGDILGENQLLWADVFSNAAWDKFNASLTGNIADQDGIVPAFTFTATGASAFIQQDLSASTSAVRTNSIWARRRTGSGSVQLRAPDGLILSTLSLSASWARFPVTGGASTGRGYVLFVNVSGDAIDIAHAQLNDGGTASTFNSTTTVGSPISCCAEITGWAPIRTGDGYRVVCDFALHES